MGYTREQLAYFAGIMDGEGTISMSDKRRKKISEKGLRKRNNYIYRARINFSTTVTVCNTDPRIIQWLVNVFGGSVSYSKRQEEHWKQKITWIMPTSKIVEIISQTLPYFVLKREQAILIIEARKTIHCNPKGLQISDEVYNRRLEISKLIRDHNQKKILPPCCPPT